MPTPLPAHRARRRIDSRSHSPTGGWVPLGRHVDRSGRPYVTAATVDPIGSLLPFDERFYLQMDDRQVRVRGRVSPVLRAMLAGGLVLSVLVLASSLLSWARTGDDDALAGVLAGAGGLLAVRAVLPRVVRSGHHARLRRWLVSILRDPDDPDD